MSQMDVDVDDSLASEATFKTFTVSDISSPLTGANAVPVTSTPAKETGPPTGSASRAPQDDEEMGADELSQQAMPMSCRVEMDLGPINLKMK